MKKFLLASHGYLAEGMLNSITIIMGNVENVHTLCAYVDGNNDIELLVNQAIHKMKEEPSDEWIVITDIFGGSVNNAFMNRLDDYHFHLVSGLNLALILELLSNQNLTKGGKDLVIQSLDSSQSTIQYCNELRLAKIAEEDF